MSDTTNIREPMLGVAAAAAVLGWKKQQVAEYIKRGVFPPADEQIDKSNGKMQPVWLRTTIEQYKACRDPDK
jgi:hypothetical protein